MGYNNSIPRTLNPTQMMLLKLFNRNMTEQETEEIQALILNHLDAKMQAQLDIDIQEKGITQEDLDAVLNNSQRTKNAA
jgi:hypothetical protein